MEMMDKIEQPEQSVNFMDNAICLSLEVRCLVIDEKLPVMQSALQQMLNFCTSQKT